MGVVVGLVIGFTLGVLVTALLVAASRRHDDDMPQDM
jgi:hypothetical protein